MMFDRESRCAAGSVSSAKDWPMARRSSGVRFSRAASKAASHLVQGLGVGQHLPEEPEGRVAGVNELGVDSVGGHGAVLVELLQDRLRVLVLELL